MKTTLEKARQKTNKENVNVLQAIIEKNYDARKGYRKAMVDAKNPELRSFLQQQARQRSNFATAIDKEIRGLGKAPIESGSRAGVERENYTADGLPLKARWPEITTKPFLKK